MKTLFICEHCKNAPRTEEFRRNYKWKTEKGFKNHKCYKDIQIKNAERAGRQKKYAEELLEQMKASAKFQIGEMVHYCSYTVMKPIHVWRGTRWVKVRYEEERKYEAKSGVIEEIQIGGYKVTGKLVLESNIFDNKNDAVAAAVSWGKRYNANCQFAARCR